MVLTFLFAVQSYAQQETKTIVLKDGSIVRGAITRQTADTLEVESAAGIVKIATSNVRRIHNQVTATKEQDTLAAAQAPATASTIEDAFHVWEIAGGVAFPTGQFRSTDMSAIGFASTGACLGFAYRIDLEKGFEVGIKEILDYYPFNRDAFARYLAGQTRTDVGSWYLFWTLGSIGVHVPVDKIRRFHAAALLGYTYGFSPRINLTNGPSSITQTSSGASAFGYGGEIGFFAKGIDIELRYLAATIEYKFNTGSSGSGGSSFSIQQPTASFQISIGVAFQ